MSYEGKIEPGMVFDRPGIGRRTVTGIDGERVYFRKENGDDDRDRIEMARRYWDLVAPPAKPERKLAPGWVKFATPGIVPSLSEWKPIGTWWVCTYGFVCGEKAIFGKLEQRGGACELHAESAGVFADAPQATVAKQPDTRPPEAARWNCPGIDDRKCQTPKSPRATFGMTKVCMVCADTFCAAQMRRFENDGTYPFPDVVANLARERPPAPRASKVRDIYRITCDPECDVGSDV